MDVGAHREAHSTHWQQAWQSAAIAWQRERPPQPLPAATLAVVAATAATLLGTQLASDLRPTAAQIAAAGAVALATLAVVPLALRTASTPAHLIVLAAALLSAGSAAIHYAVINGHFEEWWGFGVFFIASGIAQLAWAVLAVMWPSRALFWLGVHGNAAIVALWIVTRTVGTLLGPEPGTAEPVGLADSVATGFEAAIVIGALWLATRGVPGRRTLRTFNWFIAVLALVLTTIALLSVMGAAPGVIPATE